MSQALCVGPTNQTCLLVKAAFTLANHLIEKLNLGK
jgi:hypothetical protein